jgi:hypothetical protein
MTGSRMIGGRIGRFSMNLAIAEIVEAEVSMPILMTSGGSSLKTDRNCLSAYPGWTHLLQDKLRRYLMNSIHTQGVLSSQASDHGRAIASECGDGLQVCLER